MTTNQKARIPRDRRFLDDPSLQCGTLSKGGYDLAPGLGGGPEGQLSGIGDVVDLAGAGVGVDSSAADQAALLELVQGRIQCAFGRSAEAPGQLLDLL